MTESALGELFLLLVAIYGVECFRWVARGAVCLRALPFGRFSVEAPWALAAQFERLVTPGFPLPPFGVLVSAEALPFRVGPHGLHFPDRHAAGWTLPSVEERVVPWSALGTMAFLGLELHVEGKAVHRFGSRRAAQQVRALLEGCAGLARLPEGKRGAKLEALLAPRLDAAAAQARVAQWLKARWPLVALQSLLFVALFGGLGWVAFAHAHLLPTLRLLVAGAVAWVGCAVVAVLVVRRLLPRELRPGQGQWAVTLLSPLALVRAQDLVEGELLGDVEPVAAVASLLDAAAARAWLEKQSRELAHPLAPGALALATPAVLEDDAWHRAWLGKKVTRLLADLPGETAPAPKGKHCPRCLATSTAEAATCSSCHGVALVG